MDASLADDGDTNDDGYENVGRFGPMESSANPDAPSWYDWTARLFDYLTVQSNSSNLTPNFDPGFNDPGTNTAGGAQPTYPYAQKYWPASQSGNPTSYGFAPYSVGPPASGYANPTGATAQPTPVFSPDATATNQMSQDNAGVDGLININTASWKVLSMLPFVTAADDANYAIDDETIAQAIVTYRNGNGPFTSIFDLNKVPGFQTGNGKFALGQDPTQMGITGTPDTVFTAAKGAGVLTNVNFANEYRSANMVLNRISNLITTHSDTFTVYIVVEGWQNAILPGQVAYNPTTPTGPPPILKVTKRFSFIADRSQINSDLNTRFLKTLVIQNN